MSLSEQLVSTGIPGGYASRLLCDAGADIVKVEPPGGDPWRVWSAGGAAVDPEVGGALFQFLHHGMRSVVGRPGDSEVEALVAGAGEPDFLAPLLGGGTVLLVDEAHGGTRPVG